MGVHVYGIRHHGPGSAKSLALALGQLRPDCVLIEGPPDADALLGLFANEGLQPPVAILIHEKDDPTQAVYYPFAVFSPELQAARYALEHGVPVRFMDLPIANQLGLDRRKNDDEVSKVRGDPLAMIAKAAGYDDSERWWEHMVEERQDGREIFDAIRLAMTSLRRELAWDIAKGEAESRRESMREAYMRKVIRAALKEGFEEIAVVCGAWHVPALVELPPESVDKQILRGLPKRKVDCTLIPWTHGRLSFSEGYGAGVYSPGWYHHLFTTADDVASSWLVRVARLLREQGLDVSSAHVIEAVRMAETLASLRGRPLPGLAEMNDAIEAVMLFGNTLPLDLVRRELIVGQALGSVPGETPMVPLMRDLAKQQKVLRLKPTATEKVVTLDLRKPNDRKKSILLRRLDLLGVPWGVGGDRGAGLGTFKEEWRLCWEPEFAIRLIEAGVYGGTIDVAAERFAVERVEKTEQLSALTVLLRQVMFAELPDLVPKVLQALERRAAVVADLTLLMAAIPELAQLVRYGDVRGTSTDVVREVLDELVTRVAVGLPAAASGLNDEVADEMFTHVMNVHGAVGLVEAHRDLWFDALEKVAAQEALPGLLRGRAVRLIFDAERIDRDEAERRLAYALSDGMAPSRAAAFAEGFLRGSGQILVYDEGLWDVLDTWLGSIEEDAFLALVPLLRRTFSTFTAPERRQMAERIKGKGARAAKRLERIDEARAEAARGLVERMLGLS